MSSSVIGETVVYRGIPMSKKALLFAHADGDGHLAAEQSRRNLVEDGYDVQAVVVHPTLTRNWRFWSQHFQEADFSDNEYIFVVDIMLAGKEWKDNCASLLKRVRAEPHRRFHVIDHHHVAINERLPANLKLEFTKSVYDCCYGGSSELMLIASICDRDEQPVQNRLTQRHRRIAAGISRAVSDRAVLAGAPLLRLIRNECWAVFEQLADEPADYHRTFYGNRTAKEPLSPLLQIAHAVAAAQ